MRKISFVLRQLSGATRMLEEAAIMCKRCTVAALQLFLPFPKKSKLEFIFIYINIYKYKTILWQKNRIFLTATLQRCNGLKKSISFA